MKLSTIRRRVITPKWVCDVDSIHNIISDINHLMEMLGLLHSSRIGTVFGNDLDDMEVKIDKITRDITGRYFF